MKSYSLTLILIVAFVVSANGQLIHSKLDLIAGASAREYFHVGLRYQYSDIMQIGIAVGSDLEIRTDEINTYSLDHMIHFGKLSEYSNRPLWYARQGLTYSINKEGADRTRKFTYINLSAGRDFPVNDWLGFNADLGFIWQIRSVTEENQGVIYDNFRLFLPLARIQVFISF